MLVAKGSEAVQTLAKGADVEYAISAATYWTVGRGSPSTDDQINIIRTREAINLTHPVFTWAFQCDNWRASTTIRYDTQDWGKRHRGRRTKLPVFGFEVSFDGSLAHKPPAEV